MPQETKAKLQEQHEDTMTRYWKDGAERLLHVNELILRITMDAVKRQVELRYSLFLRRLETLQSSEAIGQAALSAMTNAQIEHNLHSMERLIVEIEQISAHVSTCFNETAALLFGKMSSNVEMTVLTSNKK